MTLPPKALKALHPIDAIGNLRDVVFALQDWKKKHLKQLSPDAIREISEIQDRLGNNVAVLCKARTILPPQPIRRPPPSGDPIPRKKPLLIG